MLSVLTHWGRVTHICVSKLTVIGPDNGLSPGRHQAIIWTSAGILLIGPLGTNFNEFFYRNSYIFIQENPFENVVWKMASILCRPQCVKSVSSKYDRSSYAYIMIDHISHWLGTYTKLSLIFECNFEKITDVMMHFRYTQNRSPAVLNSHLCSICVRSYPVFIQ